MKYKLRILICITAVMLFISMPVYAESGTVRIQTEPNYPPFRYNENGYSIGFDEDLCRMLFADGTYNIDYSSDGWDKIYNRLKNGEIDTCGPLVVSDLRKKDMLFTKPILQTSIAIYTKSTSSKVTLDDIKNGNGKKFYNIGVEKGRYSEEILNRKLGVNYYYSYDNLDQALDALDTGTIDVLFENQEVVNYLLIRKDMKGRIVPQVTNLFTADVAYGVSKNRPDLVEYLNRRIADLQNKGIYEELYQKYFTDHSLYYSGMQRRKAVQTGIAVVLCALAVAALLRVYIKYLKNKIIWVNGELYKEHEWRRVTLSSIADAVVTTDEEGTVTFINEAARKLIGYPEDELLGANVNDILKIYSADSGKKQKIPINKVINEGLVINGQNQTLCISNDGIEHFIACSAAPIKSDDSKIVGVVMVIQDITEKKKAEIELKNSYQELESVHEELTATEEELRQQFGELRKSEEALRVSEERYRLAVEGSNDGLWDWNIKGNDLFISPRCMELLDYDKAFYNKPENIIDTAIDYIYPEDVDHTVQLMRDHLDRKTSHFTDEFRIKTGAGDYKWVLVRGQAIWDDDGKPVRIAGSVADISGRKKSDEVIHRLAYYDSLTGLPNRTLLADRMSQVIAQAQRGGTKAAVLFLDLDNFKSINDTLGHNFGDSLLQSVAGMLKKCLRQGDTVARYGGDEFIFILPLVKDMDGAMTAARRILDMFQQPVILDGHELYLTVSMGVTIYPDDGKDGQTLLKNADAAMYRAKESGRNNIQLYTPEMNESILKKLTMENDLRNAIKRNEFLIYYQPQVDIITGKITGAEALVRWMHPERGLVAPMEFIPIAEESGLIIPIDEYILKGACRQAKMWQDAGYKPLRIAVNLSARQFQQQNLVDIIEQCLNETGLSPEWLEIEITESIAMHDFAYSASILNRIRSMGIVVSLDDFGTGYASLNYLRQLPINNLKIDRSFVNDITSYSDKGSIVKASIILAHSMKLSVTAEGVETEEQLRFLDREKCDKAQGYLFSKPLPSEEFEALLRQDKTYKF